jgi:acetyl-CoA carboxylase carboxyltransferase component
MPRQTTCLSIISEVLVKLIRTFLAVAAISLVLSSCSGETASLPSSPESSTAVERNARLSVTAPLAVENQLKA